jgi:hypothetical protein
MKDIERCKACNAEIVWLATTGGKRMPVNAESVGRDDHVFDYQRHVSHFATCEAASEFRKKRPSKTWRGR